MNPTVNTPVYRQDLSDAKSRAANVGWNFNAQDYLLGRKPEHWVYLYTVSENVYTVNRPPIVPKLTVLGKTEINEAIKARNAENVKDGKPELQVHYDEKNTYALVTKFPQPLLVPKGSVDSQDIDIMPHDTHRFVMDICDPENMGKNPEDQDRVVAGRKSVGNNLTARGIFWSLNYPPTAEEVEKATVRMETFYKDLINKANATERAKPADLPDMLTPEFHIAADYFQEEHSWHGKRIRPVQCSECGTMLKSDVAFHRMDDGLLCVRNWPKAVKAGVKTRAEAYEATGDEIFAPKVPVATKPVTQGE